MNFLKTSKYVRRKKDGIRCNGRIEAMDDDMAENSNTKNLLKICFPNRKRLLSLRKTKRLNTYKIL